MSTIKQVKRLYNPVIELEGILLTMYDRRLKLTEQVEEEETVKDIISKLRMIKGEGQGMLVLDKDMSARTFTPPPAN